MLQRVVPSGWVSGHSGSLLAPVVLVLALVALVVDAAPPSLDVLTEELPPEFEVVPVSFVPTPPEPPVGPDPPPVTPSLVDPPELEPPASEPVALAPVVADALPVVVEPLPPAPDSEPFVVVTLPPPVGPSSKKSCCDSPHAAASRAIDSRLRLSCGHIVV